MNASKSVLSTAGYVFLALALFLASFGPAQAAAPAQSACATLYDGSNGWVIDMCATDPSIPTPMEVLVDGVSQGSAALVRIYHQSEDQASIPQVAVIYASGYVRLKQNADPSPSIPFGTSFVLGPAYWPDSSTYYHNPQLTQLALDTTWLPNAPLRMEAQGANQDFAVTYKMELPPPRDRQTRLHVTQTYTATADVTIDATRKAEHQGFKLVQASSMYINEGGTCDGGYSDCHDSDAVRFIGNDLAQHQAAFAAVTVPGLIFASITPLGSPWLDVLHTDDQSWHSVTGAGTSGNTPNTRIALDELPDDRTITPQGWIDATTDPNHDNVGLWLHDDGPASTSWTTGQSAQVGYWLLAQDNPPDPWADLDLRPGLTFLDFEGSYDCSKVVGANATATDPVIIAGYSDQALRLDYDLGSGSDNEHWAQISCHFASPLDLSAYDHLRIDWRGSPTTDPSSANSLQVGFTNLAGQNFFGRVTYRHVAHHTWWGQLEVPFALIGPFDNNTPDDPSDDIPFDPSQVSRVFISVAKTSADIGGPGSLAIDNLGAYNVASRALPTDFEQVISNPLAAQKAIDWLAARQQPVTGLLKSWDKLKPTDPDPCLAYTYDQALALIALADRGLWTQADALVAQLAALQNPDGSWFQSYTCDSLPVTANDSNKWAGDIAWTVYALRRYLNLGGTLPQAETALQNGAAWLVPFIAPADGCLVIDGQEISTEGMLDAWWAFRAAGPPHYGDADKVKSCLLTKRWDDTLGFFKGGNDDFRPYLDDQTWGAAFLKAIGETDKALLALSYAWQVLRLPAQDGQIFGFDGNAGPWSVWNEGTAQYVASGGQGANDALQELLAQQRADGAIAGSPDEFSGGDVWTTRRYGVAPTAWLYFALSGEPFVPPVLAPADGAHLFHPTPTLDWGDGQDHYQVQIATAEDFNAAAIVRDEQVAVSTYTPVQALPDGVYYWRVQAFNAAGESKGWLLGAPSSFTIETLKEISYYPKDYAWEEMWNHWPDAKVEMDQDLERIQALGFNTVRIFLQPDAIGYPTPDPTKLGYFEEALALVAAHGLQAHVNLFDCWEQWDDTSGSETWLTAIVIPHQDDPRIAIWELRNELGLDQTPARDWFQVLFPLLKTQAGNTPVTASVSNVEWLADVKALSGATPPDIYSLHWYPSEAWTDEFPRRIDRARELIGQADLLIGEFGLSTYAYSDVLQADLVTDVLYYANQKGLTNLGFWTLNDFSTNTLICCDMPKAEQWYYGLYRTDGTQKPAASILQAAFQGTPPTIPSPRRVFNNLSFEDLNPYSGQLYYWWPWDQNWTGELWGVQDCTKFRNGKCSAKLHGPAGKDAGLYNVLAFPVDPGKRYGVEAYIRTENLDGSAWIAFSWFDQYGVWISDTESFHITDPNLVEWTRISIDGAQPPQPPRTAAYAKVFVKMSSNNPDSYVWFDDVNLIPRVVSVARIDPNPTNAANIHFTVAFSDPVAGVDSGDFTLTKTGTINGASITDVTPVSESVWTVTVNTGTGNGTIRLDMPATATITDLAGNPLFVLPYTSGETYTVNKILTFTSIASQDGWLLEASEKSNKGGTLDAKAITIRLGDDAAKKQYLGILSFSTKSLPDNAVITKVTLKVKKQGITGGGNPVTTFQGFMVDLKKGTFGAAALQVTDFQAPLGATGKTYGPFKPALVGGWYNLNLTAGSAYINKALTGSGLTQIRLRFKLDDNNNTIANYLSLYSSNVPTASRPQLIIEYYVP